MLSLEEWFAFHAIIAVILALDLGIFHRRGKKHRMLDAVAWMIVWVAVAAAYGYFVVTRKGIDDGISFITGYVVELSLSMDNVFMFAVIFRAFGIVIDHQHRVLFLGIISAILMRGLFILGGVVALEHFSWLVYPFGAVLIYTGYRFLFQSEKRSNIIEGRIFKLISSRLPVTNEHDGRFLVRKNGKLMGTPLLLSLATIEVVDLIFAVDSVPAVLAVTRDFSIAYTANILAVLCLRALYFIIIGALMRLSYLNEGLSIIMMYLGVKFVVSEFVHIPTMLSLIIVTSILAITLVASVIKRKGPSETPAIQA